MSLKPPVAMPTLPCSKTRMNKVGLAFLRGDMTEEDAALLQGFELAHAHAASAAQEKLRGLGYAAAGRPKSRSTLRDKLGRLNDPQLTRIDDAAGARVVINGGRALQDRVVKEIVDCFTTETATPRVKDRRQDPSQGYRAVHVLAIVGDCRVEVQVRTRMQHAWAELVEELGDMWGRELRYGEPIKDPDSPALATGAMTRVQLVAILHELAGVIDEIERRAQTAEELRQSLREIVQDARGRRLVLAMVFITRGRKLRRMHRDLSQIEQEVTANEARMLDMLQQIAGDISRVRA